MIMNGKQHDFEFELLDDVFLAESHETGYVIARTAYYNAENKYLIRYKTSVGNFVEKWWDESVLFINN